ncbi:sulfite exporter TauE/SafE family protein [Mailhella sp.]|uniref:sulfite exporter TauE/SafE family protein n=1 Tax=Mailhella sp. TaxID=1981029 RepID=UPI004064C0A8
MDMLTLFALCAVGGSAVGLLNGMLGVGGTFIIIPLLDAIFIRMGMDTAVSHVMAVGTSPSTTLFTCVAGFLAYRKLGSLRFDILHRMAFGIFSGAVIGALLAPHAPTAFLKLLFYAIIMVVCGQITFPLKRFEREKEDLRHLGLISFFFGILASMSGVAGTLLSVTYLNWRGVPWAQAVGTGVGLGLIISTTSALGYVISGWNVPDLPAWSLGYVYLPGTLCLILPSMIMAKTGAWLIHWKKFPVAAMKRAVCTLLMAYAVVMTSRICMGL